MTISRFSQFIASITGILLLATASYPQPKPSIHRQDLLRLGTKIPFAISSDTTFAIFSSATGTLARLDLATGAVIDLNIEIPKRHQLLRLIAGTNLLTYVEEASHTLVIADVKLRHQHAIPLPEYTDEFPVLPIIKRSNHTKWERKRISLRGIPATGFWISPTGDAAIVGFRHVLIQINLARKTTTILPNVSLGGEISDVAFSADESALAIAARGGIRGVSVVDLYSHDRIFDVAGFNLQRRVQPTSGNVYYPSINAECREICWSADGVTIAGIVSENRMSRIQTWDGTSGASLKTWSQPDTFLDTLEILPSGSHALVIASSIENGTIKQRDVILLNLKTLEEVSRLGLSLSNLRSQSSGKGRIDFFDGSNVAFSIDADP